jgi:hypothetical protein
MSFVLKTGAVVVLAGAATLLGGHVLAGSNGYSPVGSNQVLAPFAALVSLVDVGASSTSSAAAGPLDKSFNAKRVHLDKVVGQVELVLSQPGPARVQAWGKADTMKELQVKIVGDELYVRLDRHEEEAWFPWNLFNMWAAERKPADLRLRISAPAGTPYEIEELSGTINAGDLDARVSIDGHSVTGRVGRTLSAEIGIAGSGRLVLGPVAEQLEVEIAGSGHVETPSASAANVEIAGGGEVIIGTIAKGLSVEIAGSGDVKAASINGPLDVEIAGSGDVVVEQGTATSFEVEIAGSGDVLFKGHAMNPKVDIMGSGNVTVGSYEGNLDQDIAGSGEFNVLNKAVSPASPVPPTAPATPAQ